MIDDLKFGLKMLKYAYQLKLNKICAFVVLVLGFLLLIINSFNAEIGVTTTTSMFTSGFYLALPAMFMEQLWQGMNVSLMLQASPKRQKAQIAIPVFLLFAGQFLIYTFVCLFMMVLTFAGWMDTEYLNGQLLALAMGLALVQLYSAACYKYFVASTAVFVVVLPFYMIGGIDFILEYLKAQDSMLLNSMPVAVLISYGILFAGAGLSYLISYLFRRKPISKISAGAALRRYM